jgi:hypothetical protein
LTTNGSRQTDPHGSATIVWEDRRGQQPEVWTRTYNGAVWSPEAPLSPDDGVASRHPVATGRIVAWEDSTASGFRVLVRRFDGQTWLPAEAISLHPSSQRDPSVAGSQPLDTVVWADYRHGEPEIYSRSFQYWDLSWGEEARLTNLPGACRRPNVLREDQGDIPGQAALVAFESVSISGEIETFRWSGNTVTQISPEDGIPSVRPNGASFPDHAAPCGHMGGSWPVHYVSWTDLEPGGTRSHVVWGRSGIDATPGVGIATSVVGAYNPDHPAEVAEAWIELQNGTPTLVARTGQTVGCYSVDIAGASSLLLCPEGIPSNVLSTTNACGGRPISTNVQFYLGDGFAAPVVWDPAYARSDFEVVTDETGQGHFSLHGGGCSTGGLAWTDCMLHDQHEYHGAKSPDVDGDCWVRPDDLDYVRSKVGTSDFCADLDMSGSVDLADVAIVESTLWDHCSNVTDAGDMTDAEGFALVATPNPATRSMSFQLVRPDAAPASITILDVAGRSVTTLSVGSAERAVAWDLRNAAGDPVASGVYFAVTRQHGPSRKIPILVLR